MFGFVLLDFEAFLLHVEVLAATAWAYTEEVRVVGELNSAFLTSDVDTYRQALTVGIPGLQWRALGMLQVLLIEQAECGILQREEEVVVGVERVGVARETVEVELQLVVGALRGHDTALIELGLDI